MIIYGCIGFIDSIFRPFSAHELVQTLEYLQFALVESLRSSTSRVGLQGNPVSQSGIKEARVYRRFTLEHVEADAED